MKSEGAYMHFEGTYRGLYRGGKLKGITGGYSFKDIDWIWLEVTPLKRINERIAEEEKVHDFYYAQQLPPTRLWKIPGRKGMQVIITGPEKKAFAGVIYDVVMTAHTLGENSPERTVREPNGRQVASDVLELSGKIRFSLPDKSVKPPTLNKPLLTGATPLVQGAPLNYVQPVSRPVETLPNAITPPVSVHDEPVVPTIAPVKSPRLSNFFGYLFAILVALALMKWLPILGIFFLAGFIGSLALKKDNSAADRRDNVGCLATLLMLLGIFSCFHAYRNNAGILFYILLFFTLCYIITRQRTHTFWKMVFGILFTLSLLAYWNKYFHINLRDWIKQDEAEGRAKIDPPVPVEVKDKDGKVKTDSLFAHRIQWEDFANRAYLKNYNTRLGLYSHSASKHSELASVNPGNDVNKYFRNIYTTLIFNDEAKLDSIINYFSTKRSQLGLSNLETAEAVVTFIQEIPYYLLHDGTCKAASAQGNAFITSYHSEGKPCLPNVVAGVQSPYEFLHNLKGDCDTRSLLCYAILSNLNIPASIWVSEAYGHSVIGIGVPAAGNNYKTINSRRYYATELTSKGFRVGMISPQQTNMNNWTSTLTKQ